MRQDAATTETEAGYRVVTQTIQAEQTTKRYWANAAQRKQGYHETMHTEEANVWKTRAGAERFIAAHTYPDAKVETTTPGRG